MRRTCNTIRRSSQRHTEINDKNSCWKPFRTAWVTIIFDYGVDDIRENLQFVKDYTKSNTYILNNNKLAQSMETAIRMIEQNNLENELKQQVYEIWNEIEEAFTSSREKKRR